MASTNILFPKEGTFYADTSMTFAFSIPVPGSPISVTGGANVLYKGTEDVSTTYLSGSVSSGTTITTKTCAITVPDEYILKTYATVDGFVRTFLVKIVVKNPWEML